MQCQVIKRCFRKIGETAQQCALPSLSLCFFVARVVLLACLNWVLQDVGVGQNIAGMAILHSRSSKGVPCQTLGNPSGIFLIRHCYGIHAIHFTMQIHRTQISWTNRRFFGARELCRVTRRVRSAVSVLSHDTAAQSWEGRQAMFCKLPDSMRSAIDRCSCDLRSVFHRVGGLCGT